MADNADFFRARLDGMVDHRHPLVVLSKRLPWSAIEQALAPHFARQARPRRPKRVTQDLLGEHEVEFGNGISNAGRPRLSIRLMASLQYLKNSFKLSDEELVQRWSENAVWQFFSGMEDCERACCVMPPRSADSAAPWVKKVWNSCSKPPTRRQWRSKPSRPASWSGSSWTPRYRTTKLQRRLTTARRACYAAAKRPSPNRWTVGC
jgi:Transposase domain (DUF772)